jgi:uncharacterized protein
VYPLLLTRLSCSAQPVKTTACDCVGFGVNGRSGCESLWLHKETHFEYVQRGRYMIDPLQIIDRYYVPDSDAERILLAHSTRVREKALAAAVHVLDADPDLDFIAEAAMLHDIGIVRTDAPQIGCTGSAPYLCHGVLGREILDAEGYPRHALVCERHTGTGLSAEEIRREELPLPDRDLLPVSLEEQLICYADNFFSKSSLSLDRERTIDEILRRLARFGTAKVATFKAWHARFGA